MRNKNTYFKKFRKFMGTNILNKVFAAGLILVGVGTAYLTKDLTYTLFTTIIGTGLFFSKENQILL